MIPSMPLLTLLAMILASPVHAGTFSVTPIRIHMTPNDKAVAVTINNEGDEELVMQADVYLWKQNQNGEDDLTLTEDMLLSPPIIKVPGKSRQVIRLARTHKISSLDQLTYRMIVREIPEAKPTKDNVQLQVALAFSMPVFISPPGAKYKLDCTVEKTAANAVAVTCENTGNAYTQLLEIALTNEAGEKLASVDKGGYILSGVKRNFDIKSADSLIPGGKATLTVKLDDGTKQTFDVKIAD